MMWSKLTNQRNHAFGYYLKIFYAPYSISTHESLGMDIHLSLLLMEEQLQFMQSSLDLPQQLIYMHTSETLIQLAMRHWDSVASDEMPEKVCIHACVRQFLSNIICESQSLSVSQDLVIHVWKRQA